MYPSILLPAMFLVWKPVLEKETSEFRNVLLLFKKNDLESHSARAERVEHVWEQNLL